MKSMALTGTLLAFVISASLPTTSQADHHSPNPDQHSQSLDHHSPINWEDKKGAKVTTEHEQMKAEAKQPARADLAAHAGDPGNASPASAPAEKK